MRKRINSSDLIESLSAFEAAFYKTLTTDEAALYADYQELLEDLHDQAVKIKSDKKRLAFITSPVPDHLLFIQKKEQAFFNNYHNKH